MKKFFLHWTILAVFLPAPLFSQASYSLAKALQTARINNLILKTEHYNLDAGRADITTAKLRPNPVLNNQSLQLVNSRYNFENSAWSSNHNRQVWWQVTKTFQLPNQRKYRVERANRNYEFLIRNYGEVERNLFLNVATAWLDVWTAEHKLTLIRATKLSADSIAKSSETRLKDQTPIPTDVMKAQLLAAQCEVLVKEVHQDLNEKREQLRFALATSDSLTVDQNDYFLFPELISYDSLLSHALSGRPDLQSAKSAVNVSATNIRLQKSLALPQPQLGVIWNPQNTVPYVGFFGTIDIPLFSRNQGEIQKSTIVKQQAEQSVISLRAQIEAEVRTAYHTFLTQKEIAAKYTTILQQSQKILSNVKYAYAKGGETMSEYIEAQREWIDIQQQYFDAQQKFRQSYIQLLYVSGIINELAE